MKMYLLFIVACVAALLSLSTYGQTNTFPSSGAAGIGTTSPNTSTMLEIRKSIAGSLGPVLRLTGGGGSNAQVAMDFATYDPGTTLPGGRILGIDDGNYGCVFDFQSKVPGAGSNSLQTNVRITSAGYVGIGTTTPSEKLSVNGNILSKKVKVTQTGWADYVFHPCYKLPSLDEVEAYIKRHQHLPDIPSAAEVEKNGLDLGDNQTALLKKIEELTLYIIQQQKEIDTLKKVVGMKK